MFLAPEGRGIVFAGDDLVLAWAVCVVRSGRGGESLGRPLSTEGQIPGVMPIVVPSIFRGLSRILLDAQKERKKRQAPFRLSLLMANVSLQDLTLHTRPDLPDH